MVCAASSQGLSSALFLYSATPGGADAYNKSAETSTAALWMLSEGWRGWLSVDAEALLWYF